MNKNKNKNKKAELEANVTKKTIGL